MVNENKSKKQDKKSWRWFLVILIIFLIIVILFSTYKLKTSGNVIKGSECENTVNKDECLFELAEEENDPEICKLIGDEKKLYGCVVNIAKKNKDLRYCSILKGANFGNCLYDVADSL